VFGATRQPRSVAFDAAGNLYVGDAIGLVHVLASDPHIPGEYRLVGAGVSGLDGVVLQLAWERSSGLLAIIRERYDGQRQRLWRLDPAGASALEGRFITTALDSNIERCQWHRVLLNAAVPEHTSLQIESYASDEKPADAAGLPDGSADWKPCMLTGDDDPDCLIQSGPGQYLWLRLTFRSDGRASPKLRWMKVFFPRASYLQYLPAIYQEDDESRHFLERFLSIFQTEFDALDRCIDQLWQLFDPDSVPLQHLGWLASWLALLINPEWKETKTRQMLKAAFLAYGRRGTLAGLKQTIEDYTSVSDIQILEHFRLRRWPALSVAAPLDGSIRLWSQDFYQRLQLSSYSQVGYFRLTGHPEPALEPFDWGAHRFTVFFPADPYRADDTAQRVARVVEREKPAHTEATLCPVLPRFRVGVQATVGVDTVVGGVSHLVLNRLSTLSYDSILACSAPEHHLRALGSAVRPRLGMTTKLP
jgi:phage tail-like protein